MATDEVVSAARLECALQRELPLVDWKSNKDIVRHLAQLFGESPQDDLAELCAPFLFDLSGATDDASVRELCDRILRRFHADEGRLTPTTSAGSTAELSTTVAVTSATTSTGQVGWPVDVEMEVVPGLTGWLEQLHLTQYAAAARDWCSEMGAADIDEVLDAWEDFSDQLKLKPLEMERVREAAEGRAAESPPAVGEYAFEDSPDVPSVPCSPNAVVGTFSPAADRQLYIEHQTFGPPENRQLYALLEELGRGGFATVYKCRCGGVDRAAKVISLAKLRMQGDQSRLQERLHRETNILLSLRHPNIVALHDVVETETNGKLYLVMELVDGGNLLDYIMEHGILTEPEARRVFLQLVDALKYIHLKGFVHRDLKPDNILIDSKGSSPGFLSVKLSDFGCSRLVDDGYSVAMTHVGTALYMAPEVSDPRMGDRGYDERADLWSLGVVLYVMLEGTDPFGGSPIRTLMERPQGSRFQFLRDVSAKVKWLVEGLIQLRPEDRLTLDTCSNDSWAQGPLARVLAAGKKEEGSWSGAHAAEEHLALQGKPKDLKQLRDDLMSFTRKTKFAAVLVRGEVVVTWGESADDDRKQEAREELKRLVAHHAAAPCNTAPPGVWQARGARGGRRSGEQVRFLTAELRVSEGSAGLVLQAEAGGMRVLEVNGHPGQRNILVNDLIHRIDEVALGASLPEDQVKQMFADNFHDGAVLSIKRTVC